LGSAGLAAGWCFEVAESFFLLSDSVSEGFESGAEVGDLGGEAGEGSRVVGLVTVFVDNRSEVGVAVEGGAADAGVVSNRGERDWLVAGGEFGAGGFDDGEVVAHAVSAMRVSRRARSLRCRSASSIQPRCSASSARALVSMRCAERTAIEAVSVRKLGQCSQMFA